MQGPVVYVGSESGPTEWVLGSWSIRGSFDNRTLSHHVPYYRPGDHDNVLDIVRVLRDLSVDACCDVTMGGCESLHGDPGSSVCHVLLPVKGRRRNRKIKG